MCYQTRQRLITVMFSLMVLLLSLLAISIPATATALELTDEEQSWLADHKKIVVGGEVDWAPYDFVADSGRYSGLANDYLKIISKQLGVEVEMVTGPSWNELVEMMRRKEIDILPALYHSKSREEYLHFTTPYMRVTEYIYARDDTQDINNIDDLKGRRVAIVKGFTLETKLSTDYPNIELVTAPTITVAIQKLTLGDVDAFIGDIASTAFNIDINNMQGISPVAPGPYESITVHMGVRHDWPELRDLIQKVLLALPQETHIKIRSRWKATAPKQAAAPSAANLTSEEKQWLGQHPVIRVHNEKDWAPFNYHDQGKPKGLSIDYMNLLVEKLGIKIEYRTGPSWNEFLQQIKAKELDVMLNIVKTEDRLKYLLYTEPYTKNPNVIVSRNDAPIKTIRELNGLTAAFPKGFFYEAVLTRDFPEIKRLPVEDTLASLKAVALGQADAALGEDAVIRHQIAKNFLTNIQVTGEADIGNPDLQNLRIGVRDDWPLLHSAISKAMAQVTPEEMNAINQRWLILGAGEEVAESQFALMNIVVTFVVIVVFIIVATFVLKRFGHGAGDKLIEGRNIQWLITGLVSAFLASVMFVAWLALERMDRQLRDELGENLVTMNNSVKQALSLWKDGRANDVYHLVDDNRLLPVVEALLALPRNRDMLLKSEALSESRKLYHYQNEKIGALGYFIIAPDGISLASSRDGNVGSRNLIVEQQPELMKRVFAGEALFVPPIYSDVALKDATGRLVERAATMFFSAPVFDASGKVIAALTLRFDPVESFSIVSRMGRYGETGEAYAFDRNARLLTESRFKAQLNTVTEHYRDKTQLLSMQLRDPGGDLLEGYQPQKERDQWPLTLMAKEATSGHSGFNADGYRDYRGVPVAGAWSWSEELGIGLATEVDLSEALESYNSMRVLILGALGGISLISLLLAAFAAWIGERSRTRLMVLVEERTEELQESEQRVLTILETAPDSIITITDEGIIESFNPTSENIFGYKADEVIGQNVTVLMPEPHKSEHNDYLKRYLKTGEKRVVDQIREVTGLRKDGSAFPIELKVSEMLIGEKRTFIGMLQDISARKEAEDAVKAAERRSSLLLESASDGIFGVDMEGVLTFINPAGTRLLGFDAEELHGKRIHPLIHHTYSDGTPYPVEKCPMYQAFTTGEQSNTDDEVLWCKDGSRIEVGYSSMPIREDGKLAGAVIVFRDISKRKAIENELQERFDELSRFRRMAVGRELKMIELKKEINKKLQEQGEEPRYKIVSSQQNEEDN
jgi:PAS domain S-box-containing protein